MVEYDYVMFGDPSCIVYWDRQTNRTNSSENSTPAIAVGVGNKWMLTLNSYSFSDNTPVAFLALIKWKGAILGST